MDNLTLILSALTTGAGIGLQQVAGGAIKDTYEALKRLIQRKFADQSKATAALTDYEEDPDAYEKPLRQALIANQVDQDEEIVTAARHLMTLINPQQAGMGKYTIQNTGTVQGQIIGDHSNTTMHFGDIPKT